MNGLIVLTLGSVLVALVNAHAISLRTSVQTTQSEPFQVFIAAAGSSFDFGAGIPITRRHVLTAGSLVRGFLNWNVGFGSNAVAQLTYIESTVAFVHPNFNANTNNNNLAIIVMPRPFPTNVVSPIALPTAMDASFPRVNQEGKLIGFGVVNASSSATPSPNAALKTVYLSVTNNCTAHFKGTDVVRNFCAVDDNVNSMNLCRGDLGSAFVVSLRGQKVLAGITAVVSTECKSSEPTSFVRVQTYLPWILSVTASAESF